jgi:hypothetical protein
VNPWQRLHGWAERVRRERQDAPAGMTWTLAILLILLANLALLATMFGLAGVK